VSIEDLNVTGIENLPDEGPVVMVNLMKLHQTAADGNGSGWDAYKRYSAATMPMIKTRGGTVLWAGTAEAVSLGDPQVDLWDFVVLVQYPSRAAFLDMMTSAEYAEQANPHRMAAAIKHVIVATTQTYGKLGSR
jgi:uncharacterized protein (DUF1330 family)